MPPPKEALEETTNELLTHTPTFQKEQRKKAVTIDVEKKQDGGDDVDLDANALALLEGGEGVKDSSIEMSSDDAEITVNASTLHLSKYQDFEGSTNCQN